ncbi:hypothetical protein SUGI_0787510 [Cryptomeria japonica]|nr:hypothetical protein SUGI_0787510 [Cryptomeria japonica]
MGASSWSILLILVEARMQSPKYLECSTLGFAMVSQKYNPRFRTKRLEYPNKDLGSDFQETKQIWPRELQLLNVLIF